MIEAACSVELSATRTENQNCGFPPPAAGLRQQSLDIMRPDSAFESMKEHKNGGGVRSIEMVEVEKITVRSFEAFDPCRSRRLLSEELSPESLGMSPG